MFKFNKYFSFFLTSTLLLTGCQTNQPLPKVSFELEKYTTNKKIIPIEMAPTCKAANYKIDLKLDPKTKVLSGDVIITITNQTNDSLDKICLRNYGAAILKETNKGNSQINSVMNFDTKSILDFEVQSDPSIIYVDLAISPLQPNETRTFKINYTCDIPKLDDRFGYHQEGKNNIFQLSFCFPVLATYNNGKWNENPFAISGAETTYTPLSNYEVTLHHPSDYLIVASGDEQTKDNVTTIKADNIRDLAIIASNYMKVETKEINGIKINNYYLDYKNHEDYNKFSLLATSDALQLYSQAFGNYLYDELDVVGTFMNTAMEYPGLVMIGYPEIENLNEPSGISYVTLCATIAHEVAHQWFYNAIGNDCFQEPWLDEGFSEYCEEILYQMANTYSLQEALALDKSDDLWGKQTPAEFKKMKKAMIEQSNLDYINKPYDQYLQAEDNYSQTIYKGGSNFLYELKETMGEAKFYYMMQQYYQTYCLKDITGKAFIEAIRTFDNSKEVNDIIKKYLDESYYI